MNRKHYFALCSVLALAIRLHWNLQGTASDGLLTLPLNVLWTAFRLPVAVPVKFIEVHFFLFDPWEGDGHWLVTNVAMILGASLVWFFPWSRVERWFGTFDAVGDAGKGRLPSLSRSAASVLDALNRLRVGKGKMGGWA